MSLFSLFIDFEFGIICILIKISEKQHDNAGANTKVCKEEICIFRFLLSFRLVDNLYLKILVFFVSLMTSCANFSVKVVGCFLKVRVLNSLVVDCGFC